MTARLLVLDGGTATERAPEDLSELRDRACWLDIQDPVAGDLTLVAAELGFHPLAVEDALHGDQRPQIERYETHDFL
ncbi:MAG: CorA family divalent cation transporter, partial [Candidatus Limnocylindria bacterium]|nr:CorA family divalent cation transporter [Candidatus Limnocylindria bacterium]